MFLRGKKNHSATSISLQNAHCLIAMPDGRWPWALAGLDRCMYNARVCVLKKGTDISSNHHSLEYTFCPLFLGFVIHSKSRNNQFNHRMLQPASRRSDFPLFSWIPYFRMNQETSSTEWYSGKPTQRLPKSQQKKREKGKKETRNLGKPHPPPTKFFSQSTRTWPRRRGGEKGRAETRRGRRRRN